MNFIDRPENVVVRSAINDELNFKGGELIVSDERAVIVKVAGTYMCSCDSVESFIEYTKHYGVNGEVCVFAAPHDFAERVGVSSRLHKTFAYLNDLPPAVDKKLSIRRLAPTLAEFISQNYYNEYGGYGVDKVRELMKEGSTFGLFVDSKLAGFIGEHAEGGMGLLTVFEPFRRRGYAMELEKFLINYFMTFGRVPTCDVDAENAPSLALQRKIGMTEAPLYTFWIMDYKSNN